MNKKQVQGGQSPFGVDGCVCPTQQQGPKLVSELCQLENKWRSLSKNIKEDGIILLIEQNRQTHESIRQLMSCSHCQQCDARNTRCLFQKVEYYIVKQELFLLIISEEYFENKNKIDFSDWGLDKQIATLKQLINRIVCFCQNQSNSVDIDDDFKYISSLDSDYHYSVNKQWIEAQPQCSKVQCPTPQFSRTLQVQIQLLIDHCKSTIQVDNPAAEELYVLHLIDALKQASLQWKQYQQMPKCSDCKTYKCSYQRQKGGTILNYLGQLFSQFYKQKPSKMLPQLNSIGHYAKRLRKWCIQGNHLCRFQKLTQQTLNMFFVI